MKRLFLIACLLSPGLALTQTPPPAPASAQDVIDGTATYKFISPKVAADVGLAPSTNGVTLQQVTNVAQAISATNSTTGNAATAAMATNAPIGKPLAWTQGTNAIVSFARNNGVVVNSSTERWYYNVLTATNAGYVDSVARWVGIANSNRHAVAVMDAHGNVLAQNDVVATQYTTNGWAFVPIAPVLIPAGADFIIASMEQNSSDWFYQVSTVTMGTTEVGFRGYGSGNQLPSIAAAGSSGWALNFTWRPANADAAAFAATVKAPSVVASLQDSFQGPAVLDLATIQDDKFKVPQLSIVSYIYDFNLNILPNESNTWAWANGLRTNGMLAAGWNTVEPQDFSFIAVASTNTSMVLTQMSQFYWAGSAGGRGGVDVVPLLIPRDANGLTYPNTNTFPNGFSNLVYIVGTNQAGGDRVHVGWYWNMLTNRTWFSNEVFRATRQGFVSTFLDVTVVETWLGTNAIGPHVKRAIRTFQDATLAAAEAGNTGVHSNATHGMLFNTAAVANIVPDPNIAENQWVSGDIINGVNGYLWHGGDVSTLSNVVRKADVLMTRSRFYRPGHLPHWQFMNYDNAINADQFQSKAAVVLLLPASLSTSPNAVFLAGAKMWPLTNTVPWRTVLKDPAVIPGRWVYTNDVDKRIGVRELKAKGSGTNYVVLLNLSPTNYTQFLNVTNFGGQSNVTYTAEAIWDYGTGTRTNFAFVNETTKVVGPTNVLAFIVSANPKADYVFLYEQQLQGVQGHNGATPSVGWNTRHINRLDNYGGFCTTNAGDGLTGTNSFNLPAGNYFIEARAPAYQAARTLLTLTNITRASNELTGASSYIINSSTGQSDAWLIGRLTLEEPTTFMLRQNFANAAAGGFGIQLNISGCLEQYTTVKITRE